MLLACRLAALCSMPLEPLDGLPGAQRRPTTGSTVLGLIPDTGFMALDAELGVVVMDDELPLRSRPNPAHRTRGGAEPARRARFETRRL